jgi:hypothetical protein
MSNGVVCVLAAGTHQLGEQHHRARRSESAQRVCQSLRCCSAAVAGRGVHAVRHVSSQQQVRARRGRQRGSVAPVQLKHLAGVTRHV